jgi:hypothetical protein
MFRQARTRGRRRRVARNRLLVHGAALGVRHTAAVGAGLAGRSNGSCPEKGDTVNRFLTHGEIQPAWTPTSAYFASRGVATMKEAKSEGDRSLVWRSMIVVLALCAVAMVAASPAAATPPTTTTFSFSNPV